MLIVFLGFLHCVNTKMYASPCDTSWLFGSLSFSLGAFVDWRIFIYCIWIIKFKIPGWHYCFNCYKISKFQCFCCPTAVCGHCLCDAEFAVVKGNKGFCSHCLKLALLIEENSDADSDGVRSFPSHVMYRWTTIERENKI